MKGGSIDEDGGVAFGAEETVMGMCRVRMIFILNLHLLWCCVPIRATLAKEHSAVRVNTDLWQRGLKAALRSEQMAGEIIEPNKGAVMSPCGAAMM